MMTTKLDRLLELQSMEDTGLPRRLLETEIFEKEQLKAELEKAEDVYYAYQSANSDWIKYVRNLEQNQHNNECTINAERITKLRQELETRARNYNGKYPDLYENTQSLHEKIFGRPL